ncbi:hypothetical protein ACLHZY_20225 [Aeromonas media]
MNSLDQAILDMGQRRRMSAIPCVRPVRGALSKLKGKGVGD